MRVVLQDRRVWSYCPFVIIVMCVGYRRVGRTVGGLNVVPFGIARWRLRLIRPTGYDFYSCTARPSFSRTGSTDAFVQLAVAGLHDVDHVLLRPFPRSTV